MIPPQENSIIHQLITTINTLDLTTFKTLLTPDLKNSSTIQTYFNQKRLSRFIDHLTDQKIALTTIQENSDEIIYTIKYTLKDTQKTFTETRKAKTKNNLITSIKCETPGCSRGPFFNPGKYF